MRNRERVLRLKVFGSGEEGEDLTEIDPRWVEVLDFAALPANPLSGTEFSPNPK